MKVQSAKLSISDLAGNFTEIGCIAEISSNAVKRFDVVYNGVLTGEFEFKPIRTTRERFRYKRALRKLKKMNGGVKL